jgi:hypothetical protein
MTVLKAQSSNESAALMPFGKYKGQPLAAMAPARGYCD